MITAIATHNGVKIYTDHYCDGIFIDAFDLVEMTYKEIQEWLAAALPLNRETQLRNMYCMAGRRFDNQYFDDTDTNIMLNGKLFTKEEKQELELYIKYSESIYEKPKKKKMEVDKSGYVYLVTLGKTGYYKIGHTTDVNRRINKDISPKMPEKLEIVHTIETQDRFALESHLHNLYADKRKNGEWFKLSQDDVDYIRSL